jgi:hypothetical protein
MRIYLDNCCFNRPYDDQSQIRIRIESEAKMYIQAKILVGEIELAWSYVLDFENSVNPFPERRWSISQWKAVAAVDMIESTSILERAQQFESLGLKGKDALHIACALDAGCEYFLTTDAHIIKIIDILGEITVMNPTTFITTMEQYK